jgi:membrane protein DedA with SNARE-associated domain
VVIRQYVMSDSTIKKWLPLALLGLALVIWAGLFAAGAYFEPSADQPRHDVRKPLIVLATMATFLALWAIALWLRNRRKKP